MSTKLEFDVLANDKASTKLDTIGRSFTKFGNIARTTGSKAGGAVGRLGGQIAGAAKLGAAGFAVLGAGLLAAAPKVMDMAGQLELMGKKAQVVFGSELPKVQKWAEKSAHQMGLTKTAAVGLAAGFADLLIPMGFTRAEAAKMATSTVGLSGALAEWSGGTKTATEVTEILSAAFMGERDGLNALGISITQAEVDAELLAKGQDKLTGKALQQAEALATQKLIMEKSTDAQAAFAKGGDALARKTAVNKARLKEMGETLLVTATPALKSMGDVVAKHVLPQLERFVGWIAGDGKFVIAETFASMAEAVLRFARITTTNLLTWAEGVLRIMAGALGWHPGWAKKLADAGAKLGKFKDEANQHLGDAIDDVEDWNKSIKNMRTEAKLKANITDLQRKLDAAEKELQNSNLTKERRAQLTADKKRLTATLNAAFKELGNPALVRARVAQLQANKTDLDRKIRAAQEALKSKTLTATKRAHLQADIRQLLAAKRRAQEAINALRGKTVSVYVNTIQRTFNPGGIGGIPQSLRARAHGGPVRKGLPYVVGEERPELFVPKQDGTILPKVPAHTGGTPFGPAGGGAPPPVVLEIRSGGTRMDQLLVELLRNALRAKGIRVEGLTT